MDWAWASSLDQLWRSPTFPMWLTLAAAGFFGLIVLITLLRAERSVANGALTVITLLAIAVAAAATIRGFGTGSGEGAPGEARSVQAAGAALPALSCIDDLAGDAVLTACEKVLFGSAESTAAAVAYAASMITRLNASGDVAAANKRMTPELQTLRRAVEHDRYGLMAYVLLTREHCTTADCASFRSLTDRKQIVANMDDRAYEGLIMRYSSSWNAPAFSAPAPVAALPPTMPTGKPTNADFPTAAATPAVSIMTPEPTQRPTANAASPSARPAAAATSTPAAPAAPVAAKKPPAQKSARAPAAAPVQLTPAAAAPAADND